ncbi:MAG: F0F1 ATP synthase subunit A [Myxococcales bacterium]|nr:F0F1 ATP synthase subunit A [Myxococcales bacterium]MDH5306186.1 F0F1 ATP synthase subunit A [Myxococcales bacterium]MDH5566125.1 F0F1 ATP synthase subunit A [Myxococcales bacterium]
MEAQIFGEIVWFSFFGIPVTVTTVTSLAVSLGIVLIALALRAGLRRAPTGTPAALALLTVEWLDRLVREVAGRSEPALVTLSGSLFLFIAACNLSGQLPGVRPPTASLATTSALAAIVFFAVPVAGIRARGLRGYLLGYFRPNPLFAPLHVLSELSRTLALSVRLFGNMMSGHLVVALLVALTGFLVPMPLMALDVLIGLLQAYIFAILATVYVGAALRVSEAPEAQAHA